MPQSVDAERGFCLAFRSIPRRPRCLALSFYPVSPQTSLPWRRPLLWILRRIGVLLLTVGILLLRVSGRLLAIGILLRVLRAIRLPAPGPAARSRPVATTAAATRSIPVPPVQHHDQHDDQNDDDHADHDADHQPRP